MKILHTDFAGRVVLIMACKLGYIQVHANARFLVGACRNCANIRIRRANKRKRRREERAGSPICGRINVMSVRDRCTIFFEARESKCFNHPLHIHHHRPQTRNARDVRRNRILMKNPAQFQQEEIYETLGKKMYIKVLQSQFYNILFF